MTAKTIKSESQLKTLVIQEISKYPECRSIQDVLIDHLQSSPNWRCSWIIDGTAQRLKCALEVEQMLQSKYDLSN